MHQAAARSLPKKQGETWTATHSEVNLDASDLANLSMPSYLKDLYINLTYPNGVLHLSSILKDVKINTIQSYNNKAKSKLSVH